MKCMHSLDSVLQELYGTSAFSYQIWIRAALLCRRSTWGLCTISTYTPCHTSNVGISRSDAFPVFPFEWRALTFASVKSCLKSWRLPRNHVLYVRGLPWKLVGIFDSRNHVKSDLVGPWYMEQDHIEIWNWNQDTRFAWQSYIKCMHYVLCIMCHHQIERSKWRDCISL